MSEKITAISTPIGRGAISIVRMSGDGVIDVAASMFAKMPSQPGLLQLGSVCWSCEPRERCSFLQCLRAMPRDSGSCEPSEVNIPSRWRNECLDPEGDVGGTPNVHYRDNFQFYLWGREQRSGSKVLESKRLRFEFSLVMRLWVSCWTFLEAIYSSLKWR